MIYTNGFFFNLTYKIPPSKAANNVADKYHAEVHNIKTGVKTNVIGSALTAATPTITASAPGVLPVVTASSGTYGRVSFIGLPTLEEGSHLITLYYAANSDLDVASISKIASLTVQRVNIATTGEV